MKNDTNEKAFLFSNERPSFYSTLFKNIKIKKVLTVGSSGDQALNSILYGAEEITIIDICPYFKYWIEYKIACIQTLDFNEFYNIFELEANAIFKVSTFNKIRNQLSLSTRLFWEDIIKNNDSFKILNKYFYLENRGLNAYECLPKYYDELKEKLSYAKINYISAEFKNFKNLTEQFDLIILSNLYDYIDEKIFKNVVISLNEHNLTSNGLIHLYYQFDFKRGKNIKSLRNLFSENENFHIHCPFDFNTNKSTSCFLSKNKLNFFTTSYCDERNLER